MAKSYQEWLGNRANNTQNYVSYQSYLAAENARAKEAEQRQKNTDAWYSQIGGMISSGQKVPSAVTDTMQRQGYSVPKSSSSSGSSYSGNNDLQSMTDYWAQQYSNPEQDYYAEALRAAREAAEAAQRQAISSVEAQRPGIYSMADKAAAENYAAKEKRRVEMPQISAATGLSGGLTESAILGMNTDYENARNDILSQRDQSLRDLDSQVANIRATGDLNVANIENQYALMMAQRQQELQDQQNQFAQQVTLQNMRTQSTGSGTKSESKPRLTASQAKELYDAGYTTQEVMDAMAYWVGGDTSKYAKKTNENTDMFTQAYTDMQSSQDPYQWLIRNMTALQEAGIYEPMVRSMYALPKGR